MQKNVNKQGKRNVVVRFILSKVDKERIAAWNQDLVRVLHVFNVRSIGSCWESGNLTTAFQTELAIDTNMRVADTQTMVADTRVAVANTQTAVTDTRAMVANTKMTVSNTQTMVADTKATVNNTQTIVTDTQVTVVNTQTMVADIHRNMLTGNNGASAKNNSVGATFHP